MKQYTVAVIGGDKRIAYISSLLEKKGFQVINYGIADCPESRLKEQAARYADSLKQAMDLSDIIVGGIPLCNGDAVFSKKDLKDLTKNHLISGIRSGQIIFGGMLKEDLISACVQKGAVCHDFMNDEALMLKNAIATAEGAILEAMQNTQTNLHKSSCLVSGYGRCGRVLAQKLKGLSAGVTICSKNSEELALGESFGLHTLPLQYLEQELHQFEYIFNTIPAVVFNRKLLKQVDESAVIIDIASEPGGVEYKEAAELMVHALHCPGLPGKYAARTSAAYLADYIILQTEKQE